jgi:DNA-binding Lrp family transcriptional regulator
MESCEEKSAARETMTTQQVADRLGISVASVRRRVDDGTLEGFFTAPGAGLEDSRGRKLRGHRRVFVDSVVAYEQWQRDGARD